MSAFLPPALRLSAIRAAGLLLAATASNTAAIAAGTSTDTAAASRLSVRQMSELKLAATISIGTVTDWVAVTSAGVWIGSKKPNAVKQVDPDTNQVTGVELPGEPCAGLAADSQSLWVPLCGRVPKLAKV